MNLLVEAFVDNVAAATRKGELAGQWDVAVEGAVAAGDDLIFRVWGAGTPPPKTTETDLDPGASTYVVVFKPKAAAGGG
jgi:hypothetical protein